MICKLKILLKLISDKNNSIKKKGLKTNYLIIWINAMIFPKPHRGKYNGMTQRRRKYYEINQRRGKYGIIQCRGKIFGKLAQWKDFLVGLLFSWK